MRRHARVRIDYQPSADKTVVRGDRDALRQLLVNLVVNAVEAANRPESEPEVQVELQQLEDGQVRLTVRDNGPGPDAEVVDRLFQPFVSEKPDGTGLGLSITRHLAQLIGGDIEIQSEEGIGSTFTVDFPARYSVSEVSSSTAKS